MATLTPINPSILGAVVTPITPGSDVIPALAYKVIRLVVTTTTGTPTITVDDPTSSGPAGASQFNPDVQLSVGAGETKVFRLDCARFRDASGNINYTTSAPGDAKVFAIGED